MMSRRDFKAIADVICKHREMDDPQLHRLIDSEALAETLAIHFSMSNPRFDAKKFREACTPKGVF